MLVLKKHKRLASDPVEKCALDIKLLGKKSERVGADTAEGKTEGRYRVEHAERVQEFQQKLRIEVLEG